MGNSQVKSLGQPQVLVASLIVGILLFGAVISWLQLGRPAPPAGRANGDVLLVVTCAVWLGGFVASMIMRAVLITPIRREVDAGRSPDHPVLFERFGILAILRGALLEGPALLGCVVFLLTGVWPALIAPGLSIIVMTAQFPTRAAFENFVRDATGRPPGVPGDARPR